MPGAARVPAEVGVEAGADDEADGEANAPDPEGAGPERVLDSDTPAAPFEEAALAALDASEGEAGVAELEVTADDGLLSADVSTGKTLPSVVVAPFVDTQIGGPWTVTSSLGAEGAETVLKSSGRVASILADAAARSAGVSWFPPGSWLTCKAEEPHGSSAGEDMSE